MLRYLAFRLLAMLPVLIGITLVSFLVIQLAPGGPLNQAADMNAKISPEAIAQMRAHYGLDLPIWQQYAQWLKSLIQLDFGTSFAPGGAPVWDKVKNALPITLAMNAIGLLAVLTIAVPMGVTAARWHNGTYDRASTVLLFILFAAPSFWVGLLAQEYLGARLGWVPISGIRSFGAESWGAWAQVVDYAKHLFVPITIGVLGSLAGLTRYMRSTTLEVIRQDYITTARAKGLKEQHVLFGHALPNALLPIITILGLSIPGLIGGSVIMESLFAIPGMGRLFYEGIMMRDYPLIMGVLTMGAVLTLLGNMLADIGYGLADPRIRKR